MAPTAPMPYSLLALVDACKSGALTRTKGGTRAPGFVVDLRERLEASGQVVITSSTEDEASQESDEIGGSYFTWFLVSALSGSADEDSDGQVTLSEAYRYVYRETVFRTATTRAGAQHPAFAWELQGTGDLVLSDLGRDAATLVFPAGLQGRWAVFDLDRRAFVAEVSLDGEQRPLSLPAGHYLVQQRHPTHLEVTELKLSAGRTAVLDAVALRAVQYEDDLAKGEIEARVRKAKRPDLSLHLQVGGRRFADPTVEAAYLPPTGALGLQARFTWRNGPFLSGDALLGSAEDALAIEGLPYRIPVEIAASTFGLSAGHGTRPGRALSAAAGFRLAGVYVQRRFPDDALPAQDLFTVAPGLLGRLGYRPGRLSLEAELRVHHLPYRIDDRERGVAFSEILLTAGYRF